jgi:hypothetical protein
MAVNQLQLPSELSLVSINQAFSAICNRIDCLETGQKASFSSLSQEINSKTSLVEVVSSFAQSIPYSKSNMLYVDIYSFDGIIKAITEKITVKLQELADNLKQQEIMNEKMVLKVGQGIRLLQKRYDSLELKYCNLQLYTKNIFLQNFAKKKIKTFFTAWRTEIAKRQKSKRILLKSFKKIDKFQVSQCFNRWKTKVKVKKDSKIQAKRFEFDRKSIQKTSDNIKDEFSAIKSR